MMRSTTSGGFDVESKSKRTNKAKFFSKAGQIRLVKIWEDQQLSHEMIISSWISGGSSSLAVKENVAEYMQHFLHARYLRYGSSNICEHYYLPSTTNMYASTSNDKVLRPAQDKLINECNIRINNRKVKEAKRLYNSCLEDNAKFTTDNENILKHPIYRANLVEARIKSFETFCLNFPNAGFGNKKQIKNADIPNKFICEAAETGTGKILTETISISSKNVSKFGDQGTKLEGFSFSSGFQEGSSGSTFQLEDSRSPDITIQSSSSLNESIPLLPLITSVGQGKDKLQIDEKINNSNSNLTNSIASSKYEPSQSQFNNNNNRFWISPFVNDVLEENNIPNMYKLADEVLSLFRRKLYISKQFVKQNQRNEVYW